MDAHRLRQWLRVPRQIPPRAEGEIFSNVVGVLMMELVERLDRIERKLDELLEER